MQRKHIFFISYSYGFSWAKQKQMKLGGITGNKMQVAVGKQVVGNFIHTYLKREKSRGMKVYE